MGRTAQDRNLPKQKAFFGTCNYCGSDYRTAGASLEPYEMKSGLIKTLCHYCAIENFSEIQKQPNTFELTSGEPVTKVKPLKLGPLAFLR